MPDASVLHAFKTYVGFDAQDTARLREMLPVLAPHFGRFADHFYERILRDPEARDVFIDQAQVERLKVTLQAWMETGLAGPHDAAYYERRSRIGHRHVEIGLRQHFMLTGMNVLRHDYVAVLAQATQSIAVLTPQLHSLNRLFDIELAIMLRHYQAHSEQQLVEQERRRQGEKLAAMQALTAGLAHEVRNPLNSAKLQLSLLQRRLAKLESDTAPVAMPTPGSAELDKLIEPAALVHNEIDRLTNLLNDFLAFARPPRLTLQTVDLRELLRHVWVLERPWALASQSTLVLTNDEAPTWVAVDGHKMHQVIFNLVRNALEAVTALGATGHVEMGVTSLGSHAIIQVTDNGPGMPPEVLKRIYEPFFSTKPEGTGIGMAIVQNIVQLHGGTLEVATSTKGTSFRVLLAAAAA